MRIETVAVVGASLAGLRAVQALRRAGFSGRLVAIGVVGEELEYQTVAHEIDVLGVFEEGPVHGIREHGSAGLKPPSSASKPVQMVPEAFQAHRDHEGGVCLATNARDKQPG